MKNIKKTVFCLLVLATLILIVPLSGGCSGENSEEDNRFIELLKLLPATAKDDGCFALVDYERIWQENGISLQTQDGQKISREEFFNILKTKFKDPDNFIGMSAFVLSSYQAGWSHYLLQFPMQDKYVGYDLTDIKAEINTVIDYQPPQKMIAAIGTFNPQKTNNALQNQKEWPSSLSANYSIESYQDITIHNWGNYTNVYDSFSPPHLDIRGQAMPLAVSDEHLFLASSVEDIKAMIDSSQERTPSLADILEYTLAADAMYELGAYFGVIIGDESIVNKDDQQIYDDAFPRLKKFLTFGTGFGRDEKGTYMALALVHGSEDKAKENVSLLVQRLQPSPEWDETTSKVLQMLYFDFLDMYDIQIYTRGKVLLAKIYTNNESLWYYWSLHHFPLVLHEQ
jgi:hypothetical protein